MHYTFAIPVCSHMKFMFTWRGQFLFRKGSCTQAVELIVPSCPQKATRETSGADLKGLGSDGRRHTLQSHQRWVIAVSFGAWPLAGRHKTSSRRVTILISKARRKLWVCMAVRIGKGKPQGKWHWNAGVFATRGKHNNAVSYSPSYFSSQKETKKPKQN